MSGFVKSIFICYYQKEGTNMKDGAEILLYAAARKDVLSEAIKALDQGADLNWKNKREVGTERGVALTCRSRSALTFHIVHIMTPLFLFNCVRVGVLRCTRRPLKVTAISWLFFWIGGRRSTSLTRCGLTNCNSQIQIPTIVLCNIWENLCICAALGYLL